MALLHARLYCSHARLNVDGDNWQVVGGLIAEIPFSSARKRINAPYQSDAGEVITLVVNIAIGGPLVFIVTQILWMNLVTDMVSFFGFRSL